MMKQMFNLQLPEGSTCLKLTILEPYCLVGAFDIPNIGTQIYIIDPNTGESKKVGWFEKNIDNRYPKDSE